MANRIVHRSPVVDGWCCRKATAHAQRVRILNVPGVPVAARSADVDQACDLENLEAAMVDILGLVPAEDPRQYRSY